MQVFLPSNQAEINEVVDLIPNTLEKNEERIDQSLNEDIYSGVYIRMSDMVSHSPDGPGPTPTPTRFQDYEGCWKTTGTNGVEHPFSQMRDQSPGISCPIQHFSHITDNIGKIDDGYDRQSGEDFMMLAKKDKKFYDVSHMMTMLDGHMSSILVGKEVIDRASGYYTMEGKDWYNEEYETPHSHAFHGILGVCEEKTSDPCDSTTYANHYCVGHQKDIQYIPDNTYTYNDAASQCAALGTDWQLWYPETKVSV